MLASYAQCCVFGRTFISHKWGRMLLPILWLAWYVSRQSSLPVCHRFLACHNSSGPRVGGSDNDLVCALPVWQVFKGNSFLEVYQPISGHLRKTSSLPRYISGSSPIEVVDQALMLCDKLLRMLKKHCQLAQQQIKLNDDRSCHKLQLQLDDLIPMCLQLYWQTIVELNCIHDRLPPASFHRLSVECMLLLIPQAI